MRSRARTDRGRVHPGRGWHNDRQLRLRDLGRQRDHDQRCAPLALAPSPLILTYKPEKSLCGAGYARGTTIQNSHFHEIGDNIIAQLGETTGAGDEAWGMVRSSKRTVGVSHSSLHTNRYRVIRGRTARQATSPSGRLLSQTSRTAAGCSRSSRRSTFRRRATATQSRTTSFSTGRAR